MHACVHVTQTASGNILLAVEDGKKVGYQVGGETLYFNDLPQNLVVRGEPNT